MLDWLIYFFELKLPQKVVSSETFQITDRGYKLIALQYNIGKSHENWCVDFLGR